MAALVPTSSGNPLDLLGLPEDAIICILKKLTLEDLLTIGFVCKSLYHSASSDCVWMNLCNRWHEHVDVNQLRIKLNSAKALFRLLNSFQKLVGAWKAKELYPRGGILYIKWGDLCLIASRLWSNPAGDIILRPVFEVIGLQDGSFKIQLLTGDADVKLAVELVWSSKAEVEFELQLCESTEVSSSANTRDREHAAESNSYISNECTKLLQTRHLTSIVSSLGPDRSSARDPDQMQESSFSSKRIDKSAYTKLKIDEPKPGQELAGLWSAMYVPAALSGRYYVYALEIVNVSYTNDKIIATKIIGDPNVPCNEVTFKVTLSSVNMDAQMDFQIGYNDAFHISRMYRGHIRSAHIGFRNPEWVSGQLLVQVNGEMAFHWDNNVNYVSNFRRMHLESLPIVME